MSAFLRRTTSGCVQQVKKKIWLSASLAITFPAQQHLSRLPEQHHQRLHAAVPHGSLRCQQQSAVAPDN